MDIATLLGIIGAIGIVAMAMILGGDPIIFVNIPSILIVIGGSLFVVLAKYSLGQFLGAVKVAIKAFAFKLESPEEIIGVLVDVAQVARKGGLLALEDKEVDNKYLKNGMQLLVDGQDREVVRTMLTKDRAMTLERHKWGAKVFTSIGDVGPAMGMIGTLIGLVQMLSNMDDPKSIGPAMAVALLTTLYGAMLATMIAIPIADKLTLRMTEEAQIQSIIVDALLAIQSGQNPRVIEDMLRTYLPAGVRDEATFEQPAQE
ncbi:flagellar motor protein PomA [Oceanospirillum linum]|uniref:Flagellar motor protein PomA n=1 Tax=Oceanospirillum linum TaxID=966 RepID=A0A1T1HBY5_OCELI|nr:flagellar motor protein PomA [Oceanospirillum linum]OOV87247.1 flagellar motor protein PomA [Oceanospirillum linum]SEF78937.1 chemotaxis protein MotA [Oleiphilus messinensis]SMP18278.1 chemotaxis protein MotA [Oceanospirillum linum]